MGAAIVERDIYAALIPWLGSGLLDCCDLVQSAAEMLRGYAPYKENMEALCKRVEDCLLVAVYNVTGGDMCVLLDDGTNHRVLLNSFEDMADDVIGVLMLSLLPHSANFQMLKEYSLRHAGLSALRALCVNYREYQSEEEIKTMERLIRSVYPKSRWQGFLSET